MKDLTFVLMTCGEETERDCLRALEPMLSRVEYFEVRDVAPQTVALNRMISGVQTEFFVPVDADMILNADALDRIESALKANRSNQQWHSILFKLFDTLTERNILALKVMRSSIAKQNLFSHTPTPDVEHYKRLTEQGYVCIHDYLNTRAIGKHVVRGHRFCYSKLRDVYLTYRYHNFEWDSAVFMGGKSLLQKSKAHFDFFAKKWLLTENKDYLYCIAGMLSGIFSPVEAQSKNLEKVTFDVDARFAIPIYWDWYLKNKRN